MREAGVGGGGGGGAERVMERTWTIQIFSSSSGRFGCYRFLVTSSYFFEADLRWPLHETFDY